MKRFIKKAREDNDFWTIVAVTHGDNIAFLLLDFLKLEISHQNKENLDLFGIDDDYPAPASIVKLVFEEEGQKVNPQIQYIIPYLQT